LGALQADLAVADRRDIKIRIAYQQRAEFGFAQRADEFRKVQRVTSMSIAFLSWRRISTSTSPMRMSQTR